MSKVSGLFYQLLLSSTKLNLAKASTHNLIVSKVTKFRLFNEENKQKIFLNVLKGGVSERFKV